MVRGMRGWETMNHPTRDSHHDLRSELQRSADLLQTLRDQVRVQLHLGGRDAVDEWKRLEPRIESALDHAAREVAEASRVVLEELIASARHLLEARLPR